MDEKKQPNPSPQLKRENPDPTEGDRPWPLYAWIVVMLMVAWATTYFALNTGDGSLAGGDRRIIETPQVGEQKAVVKERSIQEVMLAGKNSYQGICQACHQPNGLGLAGNFPPLAGSEWVLEDPSIPIKIILHGLAGPIVVKGESYNAIMPGFKDALSDQQIADIVTYIRNSWGNNADAVDEGTVKAIREEFSSKGDAWTAASLGK